MHHVPQDSWGQTYRVTCLTLPLYNIYRQNQGVALVFFESFFGMVFAVVNRRKLFAGKDLRLAGPAPPTLSRWYIRTYVVNRKKENFVIIE